MSQVSLVTEYLLNQSIRDNILLDCHYEEDMYQQCLAVSGLDNHLDTLLLRDETRLYHDNVPPLLKLRVSLCRALYQRNSLIIIDGVYWLKP